MDDAVCAQNPARLKAKSFQGLFIFVLDSSLRMEGKRLAHFNGQYVPKRPLTLQK